MSTYSLLWLVHFLTSAKNLPECLILDYYSLSRYIISLLQQNISANQNERQPVKKSGITWIKSIKVIIPATKKKVETRDACTQWDPTQDNFDQSYFEIQISVKKEVIIEAVQIEEEVKQPSIEHQYIPAKVYYQCKECNKVFPYKSTYKRHLKDIHNDTPRLYLKHQKKDGKYVCEFCEKPYSHTRDLKVHLKKKHNQSFVFIHELTGNRFLQKRRSRNPVESLTVAVQKQIKMKKAVKNFPVSGINQIMVKIEAMKIPILKIIELDSCLESYLILEEKQKRDSLQMTNMLKRYILQINSLLMTSSKWNLLMSNMLFKMQSKMSAGISSCLMVFYLVKIMQPSGFLYLK